MQALPRPVPSVVNDDLVDLNDDFYFDNGIAAYFAQNAEPGPDDPPPPPGLTLRNLNPNPANLDPEPLLAFPVIAPNRPQDQNQPKPNMPPLPPKARADEDEIMVLDEAPRHLKRKSNASQPIAIDDSDDEDQIEGGHQHAVGRQPRPVADPTSLPVPKSKRARLEPPPVVAPTFNFGGVRADQIIRPKEEPIPVPGPSNTAPPAPPNPANLLPYVLDILPDLDPEWAVTWLKNLPSENKSEQTIARVVELALEIQGGYPKAPAVVAGSAAGNGKNKDKAKEAIEDYRKSEFRKERRTGEVYKLNSLVALEASYPRIPVPHIRATFQTAHQYVPTYYRLREHSSTEPKLYKELLRPRIPKTPQKGKEREEVIVIVDLEGDGPHPSPDDGGQYEFNREKAWLEILLRKEQNEADAILSKQAAHDATLEADGGIECGCCFGEEIWEEMFQCAEGHLFCRECATRHAETQLGEQKTAILCMDMSNCPSPFPESELKRLLSQKSVELYHRLKQASELKEAGIVGLESCPGCDYAVVIENPDERLFRCENRECGLISCRGCWKKEHLPKTCEEMEADRKLDKRHVVEDAMSDALIRKCPKCDNAFLKESGCNKIRCSKCHTTSCYVCRKEIHGYEHFDQHPGNYAAGKTAKKCPLWESNEAERDADLVIAARNAAQQRVREAAAADGVEIGENDLDVAAPEGPPRIPGAPNIQQPFPADPFHRLANRMRPQNQQLQLQNQQVQLQHQQHPQWHNPAQRPIIPLPRDGAAVRLERARHPFDFGPPAPPVPGAAQAIAPQPAGQHLPYRIFNEAFLPHHRRYFPALNGGAVDNPDFAEEDFEHRLIARAQAAHAPVPAVAPAALVGGPEPGVGPGARAGAGAEDGVNDVERRNWLEDDIWNGALEAGRAMNMARYGQDNQEGW